MEGTRERYKIPYDEGKEEAIPVEIQLPSSLANINKAVWILRQGSSNINKST
jgi:hypothetical protein